jgi:hypothetical protein
VKFPLAGTIVLRSVREAEEVWISPDVLFGLAKSDPDLLGEIVAFLGSRLLLAPDMRARLERGLRSSGSDERQVASQLSALLDGVDSLEELWPAGWDADANRIVRALVQDWSHLPEEIAESAADLAVAAGLARGNGKRVVVLVTQTIIATKRLPAGAAIGIHHIVACMARPVKPARHDAEMLWNRVELARVVARLPFLGPVAPDDPRRVPHPDISSEFVGFVCGDDEAEF